jgi:hypothetical protein
MHPQWRLLCSSEKCCTCSPSQHVFTQLCCSTGALLGHTSVPHQRVGVGQLRTVKSDAPRPFARNRPAGGAAATNGPGSSSANLVATGQISSRQHVGAPLHAMAAADDSHEASPLLSPHGLVCHDGKGGVLGPDAVHSAPGLGAGLAAQRDQPALQVSSLTTQQMLCTLNFWLLFAQFTVASGASLAYLNNLGQLVVSLGGGQDGQVVFVSLFSVANAAGEWARLCRAGVAQLGPRGCPSAVLCRSECACTACSSAC